MERTAYKALIEWKLSPHRKPLVLNGARQVGKTYLLQQLVLDNPSLHGVRFSMSPYREQDWMTNIPLWAVGRLVTLSSLQMDVWFENSRF